ncbi:MAG: roadblock/LC7 domain-containing protein [Deltaproteobacteria bacterium]|nr:roadblock/LC7 domain-containing protein [Deltaproteobacteria bacterium]
MTTTELVLQEAELDRIQGALAPLTDKASVELVLLLDTAGQLIASSGKVDGLDTTSFGSLTAGNVAAAARMAELLKKDDLRVQFHDGKDTHVHVVPVGDGMILVVVFDSKSSVGLVRLWTSKARGMLEEVFASAVRRQQSGGPRHSSFLGGLTDDDVEELFGT